MKNNILAIIPARGGSKGLLRKNIINLAGKPLIAHTIQEAKKSKLITTLIVSTDDKEIADVAEEYGAEAPFLRSKELSEDNSPMVPVVQHAVKFLEEKSNKKFEFIVLLQPTSPLKNAQDIDNAIQKLIDLKADNVYSVVKLKENTYHPLRVKKIIGEDKIKPFFTNETEGVQRQQLPVVYRRNGAIFAFKRELVMENNSIFGLPESDTRAYIMPEERSVDIDSEKDLLIAECYLKKYGKK